MPQKASSLGIPGMSGGLEPDQVFDKFFRAKVSTPSRPPGTEVANSPNPGPQDAPRGDVSETVANGHGLTGRTRAAEWPKGPPLYANGNSDLSDHRGLISAARGAAGTPPSLDRCE
jgi:hypothetical protein